MDIQKEHAKAITRRHFFGRSAAGIGAMALGSMLGRESSAALPSSVDLPLAAKAPHFAPKAKSVIYLHMAGSPPQQELFDWKPQLVKHSGEPCPDEFFKNQQFAFIEGHPELLGTPYSFKQYGKSGAWLSELLPHFSGVVDDVAIIKSMSTDQFNHAPAQLYVHTGEPRLGHPSMGSWVTYGLGSENANVPGFVVFVSGGKAPSAGKSVWGSGFLPTVFQGVQCRTTGDPVLYLSNPEGMNMAGRRRSLDALRDLNQFQLQNVGDPETLSRIAQYELAYRMQIAVPELMDITREPDHILNMYGAQPGGNPPTSGPRQDVDPSFANNCLLARRLVESGVRFVQLYDWGWDNHGTGKHDDLLHQLPKKTRQIDRPVAALIKDLKQRGLLDETLVVWSGEFGRTAMNEARNGSTFLGRDHHTHAFSIWMAGGGVKPGTVYGETDELGYFTTQNKMSVHDLQATILHLLGLDPFNTTYAHQGLNARLIGPAGNAQLHQGILA